MPDVAPVESLPLCYCLHGFITCWYVTTDRKSSKQSKRPNKSFKGNQTPNNGSEVPEMDQDHLPPFYGGSTDPNQYSYPDDYSYPDQYSYSDSNPMSYPPSSAGAYTAYASVATGAVHDYPASDQQGDGSGEPAYPQTSTDTVCTSFARPLVIY